MKPMPRVLFLLFSLSVMTMMYVTKFGLYMDGQLRTDGRIEFSSKQPSDVDSGGNGKGKLEVQELKERIRMLKCNEHVKCKVNLVINVVKRENCSFWNFATMLFSKVQNTEN